MVFFFSAIKIIRKFVLVFSCCWANLVPNFPKSVRNGIKKTIIIIIIIMGNRKYLIIIKSWHWWIYVCDDYWRFVFHVIYIIKILMLWLESCGKLNKLNKVESGRGFLFSLSSFSIFFLFLILDRESDKRWYYCHHFNYSFLFSF